MAPKEFNITVNLNFSELEKLFNEYVSEKPDDDGEEVYGSYRSQARDQVDDFLAWLKRRPIKRNLVCPKSPDGNHCFEPGESLIICEYCGASR